MDDHFIKKAFDFAKEYHQKDHTGHDFAHVQRVYENVCLLLKETPKADPFIVQMAALLHDVDDRKVNAGEQQVEKFLKQIAVPAHQIQMILETIDAISFSKTGCTLHFDTPEKAVLSDADKLEATGAIGICRTLIYGQAKNRSLFNADAFPPKEITTEEYKDLKRPNATSINHFFDKALRLTDMMQTASGKKEALRRQETVVQFLTAFFREQGQDKWIHFLNDFLGKDSV